MANCNLRDQRRLLATPIGISLLRIELTLDLYARNPFRILGVPAWIEDEQQDARVQRFRNLYKLRPQAAMKDTLRIGYEELVDIRDPVGILNDLREPPRRLIWELFWSQVRQEDFNNISAKGILTIPKSSIPQDAKPDATLPPATEHERMAVLCNRDGDHHYREPQDPSLDFQEFPRQKLTDIALWTHTLAILHHNRALAIELSIHNVLTEPKRARSYRLGADEHWRKALEHWASTATNPIFWEYLKSRVVALDDPRLPPSQLEHLREKLPTAILAFNASLVRAYVGAGCIEDAARQMRIIGANHFHLPVQRAIMVDLLREIANAWLSPLIQQLEQQRPNQSVTWQEIRDWLMPIIDAAAKLPLEIKENFSIDEITMAEMQFDNLAARIFHSISPEVLDFQHSHPKTLLFLILTCRRILELPLSASLRHNVTERRSEYIENLYGRFYANPHQARQLNPEECWFLPGELADPEVSLLLPVYKINPTKDKAHSWNSQEVLIPRSRLAETMHLGEINEVMMQRQAEIEKLQRMIEEVSREAASDQERVAAACATALAEEDAYRETRTKIFDEEVAPEETSLKTQVQAVEELFKPRISEVEAKVTAARAATLERLAPTLTAARAAARRLEPLTRLIHINLPMAGVIASAIALSISTFSAAKAWTLFYLAPLELSLREHFHISDKMIDYLPGIVAMLLTVIISLISTEIILSRKAASAQRALKKIEERHHEAFAWIDQVINEERSEILHEQEEKIHDQRNQLAVIAEQRQNFTQEMNQVVENVKINHQPELERKQAFDERLAQLTQRLEAYMALPKTADTKNDFPAYSEALKNGYLPGERPLKPDTKSVSKIGKHRAAKLWPF